MATDEDRNEDWLKTRSWDLGFTSLDSLFEYLGVTADIGPKHQALRDFMDLPAWEAAPEQLKSEAGAWLLRHPDWRRG